MIRHTLILIALCLAVGFGITVLVGCQESSLVGSQSPTTEGITLSAEDFFDVVNEYLTSEGDALVFVASGFSESLEGAKATGTVSGGVQFGLFPKPIGKVAAEPDCSTPVDSGRREGLDFVDCVRDIIDNCAEGAIIIREGDTIHAYSNC